jgi:biopolymer transport protein ExbD
MKPADSTLDDPAAGGRQAQLLLALLLLSVFPVFILTIPIQTHSVRIDLPRLPDAIVPMPEGSSPPAYLLTTMVLPDLDIEPPRRLHELVVTAQDRVLWNGREVDLAGLRDRLNIVEVREEWVDFRPEPYARYELFAEVLAVTKRARLERMRLDSRPFRESIDERPEPPAIRPRR